MGAVQIAWFCFAYILGLLLTGIPGDLLGVPTGAIVILLAGAIASFFGPWAASRLKRSAPKAWMWLGAGLIGLIAVLYFHLRLPQPDSQDICHLVKSPNDRLCEPIAAATVPKFGQAFEVTGKISTAPRLTRSDRYQFQLEALEVGSTEVGLPQQAIGGSVYVTLPRSIGEALYPGQQVVIQGSLYKPKPAAAPGGFNFQKYLAQQGVFIGLIGQTIRLANSLANSPHPPLLWSVQRQMIRSQETYLGISEGHLISAMVMGKSAVDVPYELQDQFRQAGLAHALAASGTQVSLLIGIILAGTQRWTPVARSVIGIATIVGYIGLTGIEPSVLRAGVMGGVVLLAMVAERKVKPLGSLLFAAVVLLVWNPLWVWNLGFQLSFLATLGLLVTVPAITPRLNWMPSAFAPLFAVPIAAYLWTIPLQLFSFGVVSPYSILVNILVSPLIAIVSIGGMISAAAALLFAPLGSGLAWLLHYPTWLLINIATVSNRLPGNQYAVGTIGVVQVLLLYGLILLIWRWQRSHSHAWLAILVGVSLVAVPTWTTAATLLQVTVLPTVTDPVLVIQDKGKVVLVNSGTEKEVQLMLLPFLQKQGINRIDWAIAPHLQAADLASWQKIVETLPIGMFYNNPVAGQAAKTKPNLERAIAFPRLYRAFLEEIKRHRGDFLQISSQQSLQLGSLNLKLLTADASVWQFRLGNQDWLVCNRQSSNSARLLPAQFPQAQVLWWTGQALNPQILDQVQPQVAIVPRLSPEPSPTQTWLQQHPVALYVLEQSGAVQWQAQPGFSTVLESSQEP
jgi:competence protein ComEC